MNQNASFVNDPEQRALTGIEGLDDVLAGGLPSSHLYLVVGDPGTGKTTLALQFLLEGRRNGETCLYVTLSESRSELLKVGRSHAWDLNDITIFELERATDQLDKDEYYTVFHPAEIELNNAMKRICRQVDETNPTRVVFDSLSEMRLMARDSLRYRRQILALKQFFAGRNCTVLLLDDNTSAAGDVQLQSIAHGVINLERKEMEYGGARRRLEVTKMRGLKYSEGGHDYTIKLGGIEVFPRLIASRTRLETLAGPDSRPLAKSDVAGIDELVGGGLDRGTSTLVVGPAGSGKSTLACQYVIAAMRRGERVAAYLFEETRSNYLVRSAGLGMDLRPWLDSGLLTIDQIDAAEISPGEFAARLRDAVEKHGVSMVVIDSVNGYLSAMPSENFLVIQLHEMLTYMNQCGVVTIMVMAQHGLMGASMAAPVEISYLADAVIILRYFESAGHVSQAVAVIKKRTGKHERSIRQFSLSSEGVHVGQPLSEFHGVLTGIPEYRGAPESLRSEGRSDAKS